MNALSKSWSSFNWRGIWSRNQLMVTVQKFCFLKKCFCVFFCHIHRGKVTCKSHCCCTFCRCCIFPVTLDPARVHTHHCPCRPSHPSLAGTCSPPRVCTSSTYQLVFRLGCACSTFHLASLFLGSIYLGQTSTPVLASCGCLGLCWPHVRYGWQ